MSSESARTCQNCGRLVEPGFKFCDGCGTRLGEEPPPLAESAVRPPEPEKTEPPARPSTPAPAVPPPPPVTRPEPAREPARSEGPEPMGEEVPVPERKPPFLERRRQRKEDEAGGRTAPAIPPPPPISPPGGTPPSEPESTSEPKAPLLERLRQRREQKRDEVKPAAAPSAAPAPQADAPAPTSERKPPLLERLRQRKADEPAERSADTFAEAPRLDEQTKEIAPESAAPRPAGATSKPVTAEELRGARPAIGGRLRWSDGEESTAVMPPAAAREEPHRPPPKSVWPIMEASGVGPRWIAVFVLHIVLAMVAGVVLVGATAAIASVVSDGSVALLEMRGLPIFIGGATAVMLFTLLRTGRGKSETDRRNVIIGVVVGFVILVVASTFLFQPRVIERGQAELEKALGVYGPDETKVVQDFANDINGWNTETTRYRDQIITPLLRGNLDFERFQFAAAGSEETLKGTVDNMQTHADSAGNDNLRDALGDFAAIYEARLSAIRLITRGLVRSDQALVNSGETRRDASKATAVEFFDRRLKPLLDRADIDSDAFGASVAGGY